MDDNQTEVAAGCVVLRKGPSGPEVLLVWTLEYPDPTLPKGRVKEGESLLECALREVREETGYVAKAIGQTPVVLESLLREFPPVVRKTIHWFPARVKSGSPAGRTEKRLIRRVGWLPVTLAVREMRRADEIQALDRCLELERELGGKPA
ncbi:MAG: NUDIX domain-containing protein [bacterium]|nr:NUDIX domain-containing protein [bacterium]